MEVMNVPQSRSRISLAPSMVKRVAIKKPMRDVLDSVGKDVMMSGAGTHDGMMGGMMGGMMAVPVMVTTAQIRNLKKGGAITIKPDMIREDASKAFKMLPATAKKILSAIKKNKGVRYSMKQGEDLVDRMTGEGIFGKKFDRFVKKVVGKKAKDVIYKGADKLKKPLKMIIDKASKYAPTIAKSALTGLAIASGNPELIPLANIAGEELGKLAGQKGAEVAKDYLDRPGFYQEKVGGMTKVATSYGCGQRRIKNPMYGSGIFAAGGSIYAAGKYGGMIEPSMPIQIGSPYINHNSPAMKPFMATRGIQSNNLIK